MSTQTQVTNPYRGWLIPSLEKVVRLSIAGGAVAMMAMAAHGSVGEVPSPAAGPTFASALQMSIGFCALALALYRRHRKDESDAAGADGQGMTTSRAQI